MHAGRVAAYPRCLRDRRRGKRRPRPHDGQAQGQVQLHHRIQVLPRPQPGSNQGRARGRAGCEAPPRGLHPRPGDHRQLLPEDWLRFRGKPSRRRAVLFSPFDRVQVPSRELFESVAGFTGTLAHETIHSTGTASRLDRDMGGMFGSESYAFEELVAELGSVMLCADLGFTYEHDERSLENHAAYLQSWMKALSGQDGFDVLQRAESLADKAATYIEGFIPKNALAIRISQRVLVEERMQDPRGIETILGLDATQLGMTAARAEMTERLITGQLLDELARDAAAALVPVLGFLAPPCGEVDEEKVLADILSGGAKEHILALMDKPIDDMDEDMVVAAAQALDLVVEAEAVRRAGVACRENASMASEYLAKVKVDALSDVERGRLDDAVRRTKESFKPVSPETFSAWLRGEDEPGRIPEHTRAQEMARTPALRGRAV
ncbi:MAG: hypothetical protein IKD70_04985 [Eggerthellaceae bacterium]|nr:hypothetical protein [Eggerthellaceae bacterium]